MCERSLTETAVEQRMHHTASNAAFVMIGDNSVGWNVCWCLTESYYNNNTNDNHKMWQHSMRMGLSWPMTFWSTIAANPPALPKDIIAATLCAWTEQMVDMHRYMCVVQNDWLVFYVNAMKPAANR